jgi:hypothetical protein
MQRGIIPTGFSFFGFSSPFFSSFLFFSPPHPDRTFSIRPRGGGGGGGHGATEKTRGAGGGGGGGGKDHAVNLAPLNKGDAADRSLSSNRERPIDRVTRTMCDHRAGIRRHVTSRCWDAGVSALNIECSRRARVRINPLMVISSRPASQPERERERERGREGAGIGREREGQCSAAPRDRAKRSHRYITSDRIGNFSRTSAALGAVASSGKRIRQRERERERETERQMKERKKGRRGKKVTSKKQRARHRNDARWSPLLRLPLL